MDSPTVDESGWRLVDTSAQSLHYESETTSAQGYAVLKRRDYSSVAEVFAELLPRHFLASILERLRENDPGVFSGSRGKTGIRTTSVETGDVYATFACRAWIQGRGARAGTTVVEAYKNALNFLARHSAVRLNGFRKTYLIHRRVYIGQDGEQQKDLNRSFQAVLSSLGEFLCGDEKLFRFTAHAGIVRSVPNKPARVGIWHYQAVVMLPTREPFLVYTRTHDTTSSLDQTTQTSSVVGEWSDIIVAFRQPSTLCMDSYYLDTAGRTTLDNKGVRYVAALKPDRFTTLVNFLKPHVNNTGESAWAWNETRKEAAVYHYSQDKNIGKKFTLSNCFTMAASPQPRDYVPVYDEYNSKFSGCVLFNKRMHGCTFPFPSPKRTNLATEVNIWDYIFTSLLINCWHIWRAIIQQRDNDAPLPDFAAFCNQLAISIINELYIA